jgi:cobyrinic acid a,c-diamide synthase
MTARIVISGTSSGVGKTTVTIGLMRALARRGLRVQGFKAGPDYIDPSYHFAATGRKSRNLDSWMLQESVMREVLIRGCRDADIAVIEGVMGLYDGKDATTDKGSTAEIARVLKTPVILLVNAKAMARSAAAVVLGFQKLHPETPIAGVIVNQVGSVRHYEMVKQAIEGACGIPVLGYLLVNKELQIPERHLGLVPAIERGELNPLIERAADVIEQGVDLDCLLSIAQTAGELPPVEVPLFNFSDTCTRSGISLQSTMFHATIAVAMDRSFNFYYPENLELLETYGAKIVTFSPTNGECVPDEADALYIGGGFPEEYAQLLAEHERVRTNIRRLIEKGMPTYAECGGYMFLTESITDRSGRTLPMVGVIPGRVEMQDRLAALGYREVTAKEDTLLLKKGESARGHEFHYSRITTTENFPYAYDAKGLRGTHPEGYAKGNLLAGYCHLHFASNPAMAKRFVEAAVRFKEDRHADKSAK